jgi:PAS domain S-box-containing protein
MSVSVLLVDDRPENLLTLEAVLEPLGCRLVRASSGEEALRRVLAEEFAVILLDVQMPGTDGLETARMIKTREQSRVTPIIFLTALDHDRRHVTLGYESGAVDYLFKPLEPEVLRAKVAAFVELYRNREALAWHQRRRYADAAIRESEERFRLVQKATNDVIWDWDLKTGAIRWNDLAYRLFRLAPGELSDDIAWWYDRIHPEDRERVVTGIHAVIDGAGDGHGWSDEYRVQLGDGAFATFLDRGYVARDVNGRAVRMIGAMQDVTARTRAQAEAEAAREDAERARSAADDARLRADDARLVAEEARSRADEANRAKSDFLATMTHELRTPINAIVGYTELLAMGLSGPVTDGQRTQLGRIRASSTHLLGLVNDVLDLAKVEAGQMTVARERGRAREAVDAAISLIRPQALERGVAVPECCDGEPDVPYVGDEHRVRQIVLNLLSNAVKFTERGGRVAVRCETADRPGSGVRVSGAGPWTTVTVTDTGIGIAPEQIAAMFEAFVQAEAGHTRTQGGTGLGLAISRRLARLMRGDLTAESQPGQGSTFTLWLPSTAAPADREPELSPERDAVLATMETGLPVPGLGEMGALLRQRVDEILEAYVARLRTDPAIPLGETMRQAELEDHAVSLLADFAQSLVIVADARDQAAALLRDGSAIQRTIAEQHGLRRHAQGWSEDAVLRDHMILLEEVQRVLRARSSHAADVPWALAVLGHFLDRAGEISLRAWRQAARG